MSERHRVLARSPRALALAGVAALGIASIVGSGGGGMPGFSDCIYPSCSNAPATTVMVQPPYQTVQVGSPATFGTTVANATGSVAYQWYRAGADGSNAVAIAGATASTYTIPAANLADDGVVLKVSVRTSAGGLAYALANLAVSASPGIVMRDGDFASPDWVAMPFAERNPAGFRYAVERVASGGNPDAWQRMSFELPASAGQAAVSFAKSSAVYDPASQGPVYVIDYSEDCALTQTDGFAYVQSSLLLQQGARSYATMIGTICDSAAWTPSGIHASLRAGDFTLVDGAACTSGDACPDFTAGGAPMRFGFRRVVSGPSARPVVHGIDNWKVTIWRR